MDSPYRKELLVAIGAVQQAAKLSRAVLGSRDKGVIEKDDLSPVTVGDFAIQALLTATIHHAFPGDKFVGEESSADLRANPNLLERVWNLLQSTGAEDKDSSCQVPSNKDEMCEMIDWCGSGVPGGPDAGRVWVFDPIDGTKTFVRGEMYAINVALLEGGKQVLSVVGCPLLAPDVQGPISNDSIDPSGTGSILFAVRGHGAYIRPLPGAPADVQPRRIERHAESVSTTGGLRNVTCATELDSGVDEVHRAVAAELGVDFPGCDLLGWVPRWSALALGLGNMTVWVYRRPERRGKIWDHAGAMLLFEEVGGKITDIKGKDIDLSVGRKMTANAGFVAAPADVHHKLLKTVQDRLRADGKGDLLAPA
ncbi:Carbohydrate phosphatase [Pleurostoma richardsiae]|uniref:Carbohydrate phosphatase n=1 Tax=Pleurostoma richardsiae TaxID=41990 RepID=A0AA38VMY0_9PEZI|nr:Carbohydrate phosphatase [Pleurostoma richardsiae]